MSEWTPVSERLPELVYGCLVTVEMDSMPSFEPIPVVLPYAVGYDGEGWNNSDGNTILSSNFPPMRVRNSSM